MVKICILLHLSILLLCFFSNLSNGVQLEGSCFEPRNYYERPIDVQRISGVWYLTVYVPDFEGQPLINCLTDYFAPTVDGKNFNALEVGLNGTRDLSGLFSRVWINTINPDKYPGAVYSYVIEEDGIPKYYQKNTFIYIDYDKYLIVYICSDSPVCGSNYAGLYLASRNRYIPDQDWRILDDVMIQSGIKNHLSLPAYFIDENDCPRDELMKSLDKLRSL